MKRKFSKKDEYTVSISQPDKNGTIETIKVIVCPRCDGTGEYQYYVLGHRTSGTCFKCEGLAYIQKKEKKYTKEHREKLDIANEKRRKKEANKRKQKITDKIKYRYGDITDTIYLLLEENTFELKDELLELGGIYDPIFSTWFFKDDKEDFETEELAISSFVDVDEEGYLSLNNQRYYKSKSNKMKDLYNFVGEVGESLEISLTLNKKISVDTTWGSADLYIFVDKKKNPLVWFTTSKKVEWVEDETKLAKFIIKDHDYYGNKKQTKIKNLKVIDK